MMNKAMLPDALYVWANEVGIGATEWRRRCAAITAAETVLAPVEPESPAILEALSYHAHERDDLTLEDAVKAFRFGYKQVRERGDRAMLAQIIYLLAAAPAAPVAAPAPIKWQPIATAPMDGTCVMLYAPATTFEGKPVGPRVTMGQWEEWVKTASEYHATTGEYLGQSEQDGGASWLSWDGGFTEENPPSHWMPLPAAPDPYAGIAADFASPAMLTTRDEASQ